MIESLMGMLAPIVPLGAAALREVDMVQVVLGMPMATVLLFHVLQLRSWMA
jgi:hypothetical protein